MVNAVPDGLAEDIDGGCLHHAEKVDGGGELVVRHGTDTVESCGDRFLIAGNGVGGGVDSCFGLFAGGRNKGSAGNAVQEPHVGKDEVGQQAESVLGLGVRAVVEFVGGNCSENPEGRFCFILKVGEKKIGDGAGLVGIHFYAPVGMKTFDYI